MSKPFSAHFRMARQRHAVQHMFFFFQGMVCAVRWAIFRESTPFRCPAGDRWKVSGEAGRDEPSSPKKGSR
jgi:hypothetical protein